MGKLDKTQLAVTAKPVAKDWVPTYQSSLLTAVASVSTVPSEGEITVKFLGKEIGITAEAKEDVQFSLPDKKLFDFMLCWLCRFNNQDQANSFNSSIVFNLSDYLKVMGLADNQVSRERYFKAIMEGLAKWGRIGLNDGMTYIDSILSRRGAIGYVPEDPSVSKEQLRADARAAVMDGRAHFCVIFNPCVTGHIENIGRILMPHYIGLFRLIEQNENAYSIARHLLLKSADTNKADKAITVGELLAVCPDMHGVRNDNLRRRFEVAMDALARTDRTTKTGEPVPPVLKWSYKGNAKNAPIEKWKQLDIEIELIGYKRGEHAFDSLIESIDTTEFKGQKLLDIG